MEERRERGARRERRARPGVDAYTVTITFDDGTESASADLTVYLVLREDGWKVWVVY